MNVSFKACKPLILLFISVSLTAGSAAEARARKPASDSKTEAKTDGKTDAKNEVDVPRTAQKLFDSGKTEDALKMLGAAITKETDKSKRALLKLTLALLQQRSNQATEAEASLTGAIEDGLKISEYAYFQRGVLRKAGNRFKEAHDDFEKVLDSAAPQSTILDARFELADMLTHDGEPSKAKTISAIDQYTWLQKRMKTSERYPDVLFKLMQLEMKRDRRAQACKWAREIYAKYPSAAPVRDWGPRLETDQVEGMKLGCSASPKDLKSRIRRLQLGGETDRAARELEGMRGKVEGESGYSVDSMLANHLVNEGQVAEALQLLFKHYDEQKFRQPYLMLLGKALVRAGEYPAAVGIYEKAYALSPRSKDGSNALFQAAFTSYQIQDYDGATRRFERVAKGASSSHLVRDAKWHLAWMRYLRGDYEGAQVSFANLAHAPKVARTRRGRHARAIVVDTITNDRLEYWSAMSLLRMGKGTEAALAFQKLVKDPAIGYYAVLSYYRLQQIPGAKVPPGVEARLGFKKADASAVASDEDVKAATEAIEAQAADEASNAAVAIATPADGDTSEATADNEAATTDAAADENEVADGDAQTNPDGGTPLVAAPHFKDASLSTRFERARELAQVGLEDGARRELGEIEKRARRPEDRKLLMNEYALVRNYYRSSTIGELGFGAARLRTGLRGESRQYWESAYPRAWEPTVAESAKTTAVPEELIWGIMRAESHYKSDAQSGVGALGLMQLMPFTGRKVATLMSVTGFETRSLLDPETNIKLGSRYLQRLCEKFSTSIPLVAAAYNAGPHRVHAWVRNFGTLDMDEFIEHIPFIETRNYVKKVSRNYQLYSLLYASNTTKKAEQASNQQLGWLVKPVGVHLSDPAPSKEIW